MHELSIAISVLEIVEEYTSKENAKQVFELELDIGELSGVEIPAFEFAMETTKPGSILDTAEILINPVRGELECVDCHSSYFAKTLYDPCPECMGFNTKILSGKELKIKSILIE